MFSIVSLNNSLILDSYFEILGNVQLAAGIQSSSIADDLTGFIIVLNTAGRIILLSDNVEYFLRKNVVSIHDEQKKLLKMLLFFLSGRYILN
jgi:hypothetical protein